MKRFWPHLCICLGLLLVPSISWAQLDLPGSGPTLSVEPRVPAPGATYTVRLNDFSSAGGGTIDWFVDGEPASGVQNLRAISLPAGNIGEETTITVRSTSVDGGVLQTTTTVTPAALAIIVEADTSVPQWYQGRAMPSIGSPVIITAIPNDGSGDAPADYTYTWRFNNDVANAGATAGQFQNTFTMPLGRFATVRVTVTDSDGTLVAERSIGIPPQAPELHFYEISALRGVSPLSIGANYNLIGSEVSIKAEPFYMTNNAATAQLREWSVNGRTIENPNTDQTTITLQNGGGQGFFAVDFHIRNLQELLQGVEKGFNVRF